MESLSTTTKRIHWPDEFSNILDELRTIKLALDGVSNGAVVPKDVATSLALTHSRAVEKLVETIDGAMDELYQAVPWKS